MQVERGTVNGDSAWQLVTDAPITLGVTALVFEMAFGRTGVAAGTFRSVTVDTYGRVVAATNPTTVAGYGLTDVYTKTQIDQTLALKANLASPALTGSPTAPTAAVGTNTAQLANTAFVQAAIAALVASSPGALDTLNELAAALGDDPNFATTMTNALALKAPLASPALTGAPTVPTLTGTDISTKIANAATVRAILARFGLGTSAFNYTGSIDELVETGVFMVGTSTTGTKPDYPPAQGVGQIPNGTVFHMERGSSNMATQIWDSLVNAIAPVTCVRTRNANGVWTKWAEIWTSQNAPKQTDPLDVTPGAMLTTGSWGVGAAAVDQPLITNFSDDIRPGLYRAFSSGNAQASIGGPPNSGNTSMSVFVGGGFTNSGYKTFLAIINAYTEARIYVGVKVTAGVQPTWTEITTRDHAPFAGTQSYRTAGVFTWHVPVGVKKAWVTVIGGGGGGGRSGTANIGSGGGGGGGLAQKLVDLTGMTSVAVTVGEGGAGATVAGGAGETGGTSSFGAFLSATGGTGGMGVGNSVANGPGPGGVGSGGDLNTGTGVGHVSYGHWGGSGGGAGARSPQANQPGSAGGTGGGGSGATYGYNGGAGGTGTVLIQW
ncbi:hypothetical protein D3C77_323360 [compost metagenome]